MTSPLALCVVAFVSIAGWLYVGPKRSREDPPASPRSPSDSDTKRRGSPPSAENFDFEDILKRAPPPRTSRPGYRRSPSPATSTPASSTPALYPSDPAFHTQHLKDYDPRPELDLAPTGTTAKPSLRKLDSNQLDDPSYAKPSSNGRGVQFFGDDTAATMVASRPAEEAEMGADLRLWDESQELSTRVDQHRVREPATGQPELLNAMDGSCSPLRLRPGIIPPHIAAVMQDIEYCCSCDWMKHLSAEEHEAWKKVLQDAPHAIFGNAPYWIGEIIHSLLPFIPAEPLSQILLQVIPPHQVYSPGEIIARSQHVTHDLLLTFFMLPFRVYVDQEWGQPDRLDKRGDPNGKMHQIALAVGEIGAVAIEWLHYIARPFLVSRMFAGRSAEILDDSVRIGIFANANLRGYIAEVTVFAPCAHDNWGEEELQSRGWQELRANKGEMVKYALGRCLNLARDWIEYRFADPSGSGTDRFGYRSGGDPLVWTRLCIRPGHILDPTKLEATTDAGRIGTLPQPNAAAYPIQLSQSHLHVLLRQHIDSSVRFFRNIVLILRPHRLSFENYRQNAWHSEVQGNERFDDASFAFMWMLCSLGLKYEANPDLVGGVGDESEISEIIGQASTFKQLDLGGIVPFFRSPTTQIIDLALFPNVTKIVLPYMPLNRPNEIKLSTASLIIDEHWGLRDYLLLPETQSRNLNQRRPINIILVMPKTSKAGDLFDDLQSMMNDRAAKGNFNDPGKGSGRLLLGDLCKALKERILLIEEDKYRGDLVKWPYYPPEHWTQWNPTPKDFLPDSPTA